jgi:[protein-PII] uridylyltransferase
MDIFYLFNGMKYFHIDFDEAVSDEELLYVRQILDETLVSDRKAALPEIKISPKEIKINCHHSRSYAKMQVTTTDQKGLMANIISVFDDIGIDIASAKIQTIKKRARNLFLIEKNGYFCTNRELVVERLTSSKK